MFLLRGKKICLPFLKSPAEYGNQAVRESQKVLERNVSKWSSASSQLESRGGLAATGIPWASSTTSSHRDCGISRCCQRSCQDYRVGDPPAQPTRNPLCSEALAGLWHCAQ